MSLLSIPRSSAEPKRPTPRLHTDEVLVDRQTYRDLEIFDADGAPSLYDLLDKTRTNGGSKALEARMRKPRSSVERIRAVQDSLRFILSHRLPFNAIPGESTTAAIEQYLFSGITVVTSRNRIDFLAEAITARLTEGRQFWHLKMGVPRMCRLIESWRRLACHPDMLAAPGELGPMLAEMRTLLENKAFADLPAVESDKEFPFWSVVRLDATFRYHERSTVDRLFRLMFEIDALVAMADAIQIHGLLLPEVVDGPLFVHAEGVYHPFVKNAVPNDIRIDQDKRLLFVTGPNMAGKTTLMRATGMAVYLAHLGMGVPARSFRFSPCDSLFTAITLADNVREGISFFRAEALRIKAIATATAEARRVIGLLDEPFMGTNVKDAVDASRAVLLRLAEIKDSVFMVSSHLIELGEALEATGSAHCVRFDADENSERLQFDYILRPGVSSQRLGLRVLKQEGVFDLLDRAVNPMSD